MRKTLSLLLAGTLIACQSEDISLSYDTGEFEGSVEISEATRTHLSGSSVKWDIEDMVSIYEGSTNPNKYMAEDISSNGSSCRFTLQGERINGEAFTNNIALYPYSSQATIEINEEGFLINGLALSSEQSYTEDSFGKESFPMVAVTNSIQDKKLNFKNICGTLKIKLRGIETIKSISLQGNADEILAGDIEIRVSPSALPTIDFKDNVSEAITLDCGEEGVRLDAWENTSFVFVLPPVEFKKGFTLTVTLTDGTIHKIASDTPQTIFRSATLSMPAISLDGTVLEGGEQINIETVEAGLFDIKVKALINAKRYLSSIRCNEMNIDKEDLFYYFMYLIDNDNIDILTENPYPTGAECSIMDIAPVCDNILRPGATYNVYFIAYDEDKTDYSIDDVYLYTETTSAPTFDGTSEVRAEITSNTYSSITLNLNSEEAHGIYYEWIHPSEYEEIKDNITEYLTVESYHPLQSGNNINIPYSYPEYWESIYLVAVAIDKDGRIGKPFAQEYHREAYQTNDIDVDVNIVTGSTIDDLSFEIVTDKESYGYYCILLPKTSPLFTDYPDDSDLLMYFVNNCYYTGYYNPTTESSLRYTHQHIGETTYRSCFIVMALDANGIFSNMNKIDVTFEPEAEMLSGWGVVGTFNDWGNDNSDVQMALSGDWLVASDINIEKGGEIKFRKDKEWDVNYGAYQFEFEHNIDQVYTNPEQYGPNIIIPEAGKYDFYLSKYFDEYYYTTAE